LIVPDWATAKSQGLDENGMNERVQQLVDRVNAGLGHWETVKYFTLLRHDFTEDSGELSLKLDVKRKVVAEHFHDEIEAMYTGKSKPS
jgi:long-chain acyl-CoA synthetase